MSQIAIAGLQLELTQGDNLATIEKEIISTMARFPWLKMLVIGELAPFGSGKDFAQPLPGPAEQFLCGLAKNIRFGWYLVRSMKNRQINCSIPRL